VDYGFSCNEKGSKWMYSSSSVIVRGGGQDNNGENKDGAVESYVAGVGMEDSFTDDENDAERKKAQSQNSEEEEQFQTTRSFLCKYSSVVRSSYSSSKPNIFFWRC